MKSYKQFVAEANAKVLGKVKGSQVKYKRMDDLGQNPSNYENLDTSGQDPHTLGTGALNTSALKMQLANPTIIDDPDGTPAEKTRIMKPFKGKY